MTVLSRLGQQGVVYPERKREHFHIAWTCECSPSRAVLLVKVASINCNRSSCSIIHKPCAFCRDWLQRSGCDIIELSTNGLEVKYLNEYRFIYKNAIAHQ